MRRGFSHYWTGLWTPTWTIFDPNSSNMAKEQERRGLRHYLGVTWLNISDLDRARGDAGEALGAATRAVDALATATAGFELETARIARSWALVHENRMEEAGQQFQRRRDDTIRCRSRRVARRHSLHSRSVRGSVPSRGPHCPGDGRSAPVRRRSRHVAPDHGRDRTPSRIMEAGGGSFGRLALDRPHPSFAFLARARLATARLAVASSGPTAQRDVSAAVLIAALQGARLYSVPRAFCRGSSRENRP